MYPYYSYELPYWRRIWQITSGYTKNISLSDVEHKLMFHREAILTGILFAYYKKPIAIKEQECWSMNFPNFLYRLGSYLMLPEDCTWFILKCYFQHDSSVSFNTLQSLKDEQQMVKLLSNIWDFFTSERMFILKIMEIIIENHNEKEHPLVAIFNKFINDLSWLNIWKSLIEQFSYLSCELTGSYFEMEKIVKWKDRNLSEMNQILSCLIIISNHVPVSIQDFHIILRICVSHDFGENLLDFPKFSEFGKRLYKILKFSEVGLLLSISNKLRNNNDNSWYDLLKPIKNDIVSLKNGPAYAAVRMIWIILHMNIPNKTEILETELNELFRTVIEQQCFKFYNDLLSCISKQNLSNLVIDIIQISLFNLLAISCKNLNQYGNMLSVPGVVSILNILLKNSYFAEEYFTVFKDLNSDHVHIWSTAVELFPYDFVSLTSLAESLLLAKLSSAQKVFDKLLQLTWFSEEYDPNTMKHTFPEDNSRTVQLLSPYSSTKPNLIFIEKYTQLELRKQSDVLIASFQGNYSFWFFLISELKRRDIDPQNIEAHFIKLENGLKVLLSLLKSNHNAIEDYAFCKEVISETFNVLEWMCTILRKPSISYITYCLYISTEILYKHPEFILNTNIMELIPVLTQEFNIFNFDIVKNGFIGDLILHNNYYNEKELHSILLSYLILLRTSIFVKQKELRKIYLPGFLFVLKNVFTNIRQWFEISKNNYRDILYQCVQFIYEAMLETPTEQRTDDLNMMNEIGLDFFLNENCGIELLSFISIGNVGVQNAVEKQSYWCHGKGALYVYTIEQVFRILNYLLNLRSNVPLSRLEVLIYTNRSDEKLVETIASFLHFPYKETIPVLAGQLITKICTCLETSMFIALNHEQEYITLKCMERLRDPYECNNIKIVIIELITASISKQWLLIFAFCYTEEKLTDQSKIFDTKSFHFNYYLSLFITDYLYLYSQNDLRVNDDLVVSIIGLTHAMWKHNVPYKSVLTKCYKFWLSLCYSLSRNILASNNHIYSKIFDTIANELYKSRIIQPTLIEVLTDFFETNNIRKWTEHIYKHITETELFISWKDFLIMTIKFLPSTIYSIETKKILLQETQNKFMKIKDCKTMDEINFQMHFGELYLYLISQWQDTAFTLITCEYSDIFYSLQVISICYMNLTSYNRKVLLTMAHLIIRRTKFYIHENQINVKSIIEMVNYIFNFECGRFDSMLKEKQIHEDVDLASIEICFDFYKELSAVNILHNHYEFEYESVAFLRNVISCINKILNNTTMTVITRNALEILFMHMDEPRAQTILYKDIAAWIWLTLEPPNECIQNIKIPVPSRIIQWWSIYKIILQDIMTVLKNHVKYTYLMKEIFIFFIHQQIYIRKMLLLISTLQICALELIDVILAFINELFKYYSTNENCKPLFISLTMEIRKTLSYASFIITNPDVIPFIDLNEIVPTNRQILITHKLADLVTQSLIYLSQMSTTPAYQSAENNINSTNVTLLIDTNFELPLWQMYKTSDLNFGLVFSLMDHYIDQLNAIEEWKTEQNSQSDVPKNSNTILNEDKFYFVFELLITFCYSQILHITNYWSMYYVKKNFSKIMLVQKLYKFMMKFGELMSTLIAKPNSELDENIQYLHITYYAFDSLLQRINNLLFN